MNQAFTEHRNQIVAMVNRTKPAGSQGFEPYAMWFAIEPGPHESLASKGDASKASEVTKPRLYRPETVDLAYARTLWVGADNYKAFCQLYKDTEPWQTQFPKSAADADAHTSDTPAFTGDPDAMTEGQASLIVGCLEAKSIDKDEFQQMILTVTAGATSNYGTLKRDEAAELIEIMKAY